MCEEFSVFLGKSKVFCLKMYEAGLYHDIGKAVIDQNTLYKKGSLTIEEWSHIKKHVIHSRIIVSKQSDDLDLISIVGQHHENENGKGYPRGLNSHEIHEGAKILKICDIYISLRESRSYRNSFDLASAMRLMQKMADDNEINGFFFEAFKSMLLDDLTEDVYLKAL